MHQRRRPKPLPPGTVWWAMSPSSNGSAPHNPVLIGSDGCAHSPGSNPRSQLWLKRSTLNVCVGSDRLSYMRQFVSTKDIRLSSLVLAVSDSQCRRGAGCWQNLARAGPPL